MDSLENRDYPACECQRYCDIGKSEDNILPRIIWAENIGEIE